MLVLFLQFLKSIEVETCNPCIICLLKRFYITAEYYTSTKSTPQILFVISISGRDTMVNSLKHFHTYMVLRVLFTVFFPLLSLY